jgi:hypothetical protein
MIHQHPVQRTCPKDKVPDVAQHRTVRPGYTVIHPNRERSICKVTRIAVALVLLVSIALMLAVTIGGWTKLQGMKPVNFIWCAIYLVMAVYVLRWARGLLPIAAALAVLLMTFAVIAATGAGGTSWFERGQSAYGHAGSLFGGAGLSAGTIGGLMLVLVGVELLLVVVSIFGFSQGWNVELEVPDDEARRRGYKVTPRGPTPATA